MMKKLRASGKFSRFSIGVLLAALAGFALAACGGGNRPNDPYVSVPDAGVTVEDIVFDPEKYVGKRVTVAATVKGTFGERAFLLHGEKLVDELLAVGADPYPEMDNDKMDYPLHPVKAVRVTGVVRHYDGGVERETGVRLDDARLKDYAGKPVIVVESLQPAEK
jgi:hypothetical protein